MASFLLVHGAWHGAWCWERPTPLLRSEGHEVRALDLPAHGRDRSAPWRATLRGYGARVAEAAGAFSERPVVVGHSMGGVVITQAAASRPEAVAGLIYLCAFVPQPGESLLRLGRRDPDSAVGGSMQLAPRGFRIRQGRARDVFYGACSEADARWASERLCAEPPLPLLQRVRGQPPAGLPRAYVFCTEDRAIGIGWQRAMAERASIARSATLRTDHSPFLSAPCELAKRLVALAAPPDVGGAD
jgi:pimeloyl-ACP methyl ester carboxylesterase